MSTENKHLTEFELLHILATERFNRPVDSKPMPTARALAYRHIMLSDMETSPVHPTFMSRVLNCSYESVRRFLRHNNAMLKEIICDTGRSTRSGAEVMRVIQIFDVMGRHISDCRYVFHAPLKRELLCYLLDKRKSAPISVSELRASFGMSHEALRQLINDFDNAGLIETTKKGRRVFIKATEKIWPIVWPRLEETVRIYNNYNDLKRPYRACIDGVITNIIGENAMPARPQIETA